MEILYILIGLVTLLVIGGIEKLLELFDTSIIDIVCDICALLLGCVFFGAIGKLIYDCL